jgi:homocysteine S-methyltransferase
VSYEKTKQRLDQGGTVILDGGTGTELERRGASMNPEAWCGAATLENLELLEQVHQDYIAVGSRVITANTYASSRLMLEPAGLSDSFDELNRSAVRAAHRARQAAGVDEVLVAGSLSHMVPMVPGEAANDRSRNPTSDQLDEAFGELASLLKEEGCDLIMMEMMFHPERIEAAVNAAVNTGLPVWLGMSARRGEDGSVLSVTPEADIPFAEVVELGVKPGVEVAGVMHSDSNVVADAVDVIRGRFDGPLMAYPDSGYFAMPNWKFEDIIPPEDLGRFASGWRRSGVQVLGGCCGLSPEHISAIVAAVDADAEAGLGQ